MLKVDSEWVGYNDMEYRIVNFLTTAEYVEHMDDDGAVSIKSLLQSNILRSKVQARDKDEVITLLQKDDIDLLPAGIVSNLITELFRVSFINKKK